MITEITSTKYVTNLDAGALVTVIENTGGLVTALSVPGTQGAKGDPGPNTIGGSPINIAPNNLMTGDVLQFGGAAWVNTPQEQISDGGNF